MTFDILRILLCTEGNEEKEVWISAALQTYTLGLVRTAAKQGM
jgi:hypothetical protein